MTPVGNVRNWLKAVRAAYLPASVIPVFTGLALAWSVDRTLAPVAAAVTVLGVALAHMSADLFNDYFDYRHGTDQLSPMRGLSGGTGVLVEGILEPEKVLEAAAVLLTAALASGVYLALTRGAEVILLMGFGALTIVGYTSILQQKGLGETTLVAERVLTVLGSYYVQTHSFTPACYASGLALGITSAFVVYYAAFPDYAADKATGKKTLVVLLGEGRAKRFSPVLPAAAYAVIALSAATHLLPIYSLALFGLTPLAYAAIQELEPTRGSGAGLGKGLRYSSLYARLFGVVLTLSLL